MSDILDRRLIVDRFWLEQSRLISVVVVIHHCDAILGGRQGRQRTIVDLVVATALLAHVIGGWRVELRLSAIVIMAFLYWNHLLFA